jgi:hypothetical protein
VTVEVLFPGGEDGRPVRADVDAILADVASEPAGGRLVVGDKRIVDWLIQLSRSLLARDLARRYPELGSLGFFLRRAELRSAVASLEDGTPGVRHAPRGLAVHFPPANVDTIFMYSWAVSALAGNANVVRLSSRASAASAAILQVLRASLADADPAVGRTQRVIAYERNDETTSALMAGCAVRVLWGGDVGVRSLRAFPIAPLARELAFPDRSSIAAISVAGWEAATAAQRGAAVDGFANDVYWFDQAACSSPRDLVWIGDAARAAVARREFESLLVEVVAKRGWVLDPAMAIQKRVSTFGLAADGVAQAIRFDGNAIANVDLVDGAALRREWLGAGTVCHVVLPDLDALVPLVERRDQTLGQFGFGAEELDAFVTRLAGRGIDRIVPFGQALAFGRTWDGMDLMREFTRIITIRAR